MKAELALIARNDQLEKEISDVRALGLKALKLVRIGALGAVCPSCGAKVSKPCYGNGPLWPPHEVRGTQAMKDLEEVLAEMADVL